LIHFEILSVVVEVVFGLVKAVGFGAHVVDIVKSLLLLVVVEVVVVSHLVLSLVLS
jgi:hypothetical protein